MKAFYFLSAVTELGISNDAYALFSKNTQIDAAGPRAGRDLIAKIKDTPVACVQTENQFIFYL